MKADRKRLSGPDLVLEDCQEGDAPLLDTLASSETYFWLLSRDKVARMGLSPWPEDAGWFCCLFEYLVQQPLGVSGTLQSRRVFFE